MKVMNLFCCVCVIKYMADKITDAVDCKYSMNEWDAFEADLDKYLSSAILYRGHRVKWGSAQAAMAQVIADQRVQYAGDCRVGFELGLVNTPCAVTKSDDCVYYDQNVTFFGNNTGIHRNLQSLIKRYRMMAKSRVCMRHFESEGMGSGELNEAAVDLEFLVKDYKAMLGDDLKDDDDDAVNAWADSDDDDDDEEEEDESSESW